MYGAAGIFLAGVTGWALYKGWNPVFWGIVAVLLITVYPLLLLAWHGDPLELDRHGLQIAIQFRLAFWLTLILLLDQARVRLFPLK